MQENSDLAAFERHRREFIEVMKEIHKRNPNVSPEKLQQMAEVSATGVLFSHKTFIPACSQHLTVSSSRNQCKR